MDPIIPAQQTFAVLAALFAIALFGFWAEQKHWGKLMTGAVWAILSGVVLSNLHIIPQSSPAYGVVFSYFVPLLLPLFLMHANVKRIIAETGRVGIAFILACLGTVLGVIIGASLIDLGDNEAILAGMFTATYTGGSANFAALVQSTGFEDANAISAATAVDNLLGILFLAIIILMPSSHFLMKRFVDRNYQMDEQATLDRCEQNVSSLSIAASLTFAMTVVAISDSVVAFLNALSDKDLTSLRYLFITLFSVLPATLLPKQMQKMHGGQSVGLVLALVFFAALAAGADIASMLSYAPILMVFVAILLLSHGIVTFGGAILLNTLFKQLGKEQELGLSLPELIIASNAAILGATTAPALAMARGWGTLVTPGILVGVAGYIIGTPLGLFIVSWW